MLKIMKTILLCLSGRELPPDREIQPRNPDAILPICPERVIPQLLIRQRAFARVPRGAVHEFRGQGSVTGPFVFGT